MKDKVRETFLALTSTTVPHGKESYMEKHLPPGFSKDSSGNYYYRIGESKTLFTSHLDTVCTGYFMVEHTFDGRFIGTVGPTTLGADDKAGVTIMLMMIEQQVPGTYVFFTGEESGGIGSSAAADSDYLDWEQFERCVSFDRSGYSDVITYQSGGNCASQSFARALCDQLFAAGGLYYRPCDGGIFTDSANFTHLIPECTNISVGYFGEHTHGEKQDIEFLAQLAEACCAVQWESLPVERKPVEKYSRWGGGWGVSPDAKSWWEDYKKRWEDDYEEEEEEAPKTSDTQAALKYLQSRLTWYLYNDMNKRGITDVSQVGYELEPTMYLEDYLATYHFDAYWEAAMQYDIEGEVDEFWAECYPNAVADIIAWSNDTLVIDNSIEEM